MNRIFWGGICAVLALCAFLASPAQAQTATVSADATLSWTLPTTDTGGNALTGSLAITKVRVYLSTSTISPTSPGTPTAELLAGTGGAPVSTTQTITVANGGTLYARVAVCNAAGCGALTNEVTKVVTVPAPGVATNVTITITIKP